MSSIVAMRFFERPVTAGRPPHLHDDPSCDALRDRVLDIIRSAAGNPGLTLGDVAAEIGITERTLLRAFEHEPQSVTGHLAQARLDLALAHLASSRHRHQDLAVIAQRSGYTSVADLERAVLTATGLTPAEYRDEADRRPSMNSHRPVGTSTLPGPTMPGRRADNPFSFLS